MAHMEGNVFIFDWLHPISRAGASRTRQKRNRHKISIADYTYRELRLSRAIPSTGLNKNISQGCHPAPRPSIYQNN